MANDHPVKLQLFEAIHIRSAWDESDEKWWLSALDVVSALTDQADYTKARNYWKWLKTKLKQEGSEVVSVTHQLKMEAPEYKQHKGLKKENLRDNMTNTELVMNMLAELSTKEISEAVQPQTLPEHASVAKRGGSVAKQARLKLEAETGKEVVSSQNAKQNQLINKNQKLAGKKLP